MAAKTPNPFDFIDTVIDPIPVVGQIWADAMYTILGLSDAYNQRKLGYEMPPLPPRQSIVVDMKPKASPNGKLPKAA